MRVTASCSQCCLAARSGERKAGSHDIGFERLQWLNAAPQGWERRKRRGHMIETHTGVVFSPDNLVKRRISSWRGISTDTVELLRLEPFEYRLRAPYHLLIASHRAERRDGETMVEGLPRSTRREFSRRLTFVPAGGEFSGWQDPRKLTRVTYFYIDPKGPLIDPDRGVDATNLRPRLFFEDSALWATVEKLTQEAERAHDGDPYYIEALSVVLVAELTRHGSDQHSADEQARGGLAGWQKRVVDEQIEAHLAEPLSLLDLAELARLSPRHFARAFKESFGQPPHHYHLQRRVERAKALLATGEMSVTEIAVTLGFADTSALSTTFRRFTGGTPRDYRRQLA
jgi:AraC family transcriptional regulator